MTSKEALLDLFDMLISDNACDVEDCETCASYIKNKCSFYQKYQVIEKDLKWLEEINNAKPSVALEGVDILYANALDLTTENTKYLPKFLKPIRDKIKQSLIQAKKEHKALEIIKEKNVDMFEVMTCSSAEAYNNRISISYKKDFIKDYELTEEEFNLLKES